MESVSRMGARPRFGFAAGDGLRRLAGTPASTLPRSRRIDAERAVALTPTVRRDGLVGALLAYDGQLIDSSADLGHPQSDSVVREHRESESELRTVKRASGFANHHGIEATIPGGDIGKQTRCLGPGHRSGGV